MEVQVSLDYEEFTKKPDKEQTIAISSRIAEERRCMEPTQIAVAVGDNGRTFCPAVFTGRRRKAEKFAGMQLFTLDFDKGIFYQEIRIRAVRYDIPICFSYHTFSAEPGKEKFRVCFLHKCSVTDCRAAEFILGMLMKIFPECDTQCSDLSRMFYGGKGLIEQGQDTFDIVRLAISFQAYLRQREESQYKRNLEHFAKQCHIKVKSSSLAIYNASSVCVEDDDKNVDFQSPDYYIIIGADGKSTIREDPYIIELDHPGTECRNDAGKWYHGKNKGGYKIKDIGDKAKRCRLLTEFLSGEDVEHDGRFHIVTNLRFIRGGKRLFLGTIEKYGYDLPKWKETYGYTRDNHYSPQGCQKCKYSDICRDKGTLLSILRDNTDHRVLVTKERQYISMKEGEEKLWRNIEKAVRSSSSGLHLIRAQTALGKTEACCKAISENMDKRFIMALPVTRLKEEVYERLKKMGIQAVMTASIDDEGFPREVALQIRFCYDIGVSGTAQIIKDYLREHKGEDTMEVLMCRKYLENKKELEDARVILTTHARLLSFEKEFLDQFTVIVDEDILQLYMFNQIIKVNTKSLREACRESRFDQLRDRVETILETPEDTYGSLKPSLSFGQSFSLNQEELSKLGSGSENVNDLLKAAAFVKHSDGMVNYFCPAMLKPGKYIILSATLNKTVYSLYFKNMDIISYEQPLVEYAGKLEQYTFHSLGRTDLKNKSEEISRFIKSLGVEKWETITFKKFAEGTNSVGLYYGNQAGSDKLKGKNLVIIGTPYTVEDRYKLVAHYLGVDVNRKADFMPHRKRIEYNGYDFLHTTYENGLLREIQVYSIGSELEQAVGRARLLREECTVILFSSFPCEQAHIHEEDYLREDSEAEKRETEQTDGSSNVKSRAHNIEIKECQSAVKGEEAAEGEEKDPSV